MCVGVCAGAVCAVRALSLCVCVCVCVCVFVFVFVCVCGVNTREISKMSMMAVKSAVLNMGVRVDECRLIVVSGRVAQVDVGILWALCWHYVGIMLALCGNYVGIVLTLF